MTWKEQDHPRDSEGKFTFKEGGASNKGPGMNMDPLRGGISYNPNPLGNIGDIAASLGEGVLGALGTVLGTAAMAAPTVLKTLAAYNTSKNPTPMTSLKLKNFQKILKNQTLKR